MGGPFVGAADAGGALNTAAVHPRPQDRVPPAVEAPADVSVDAPAYALSVRSLCEFTAKQGDLDRRFTPSATALEGLQGEAAVAARRGPDYDTQIRLQRRVGLLLLRGRADGYDRRSGCLEEVKTIRGAMEDVPENRRWLHWSQLQCYGALFCAERELPEIDLSLVYFDIDSQQETVVRERFAATQLEDLLQARCQQFSAWAQQETAHRAARDAALRALAFPLAAFRPGQRTLSEAVYRATLRGRCLLAQAPTGIGKTLGTLYPMLRAAPEAALDKVAYLTCKNTARVGALQALSTLRAAAPAQPLRVLDVLSKEQGCVQPGKACHSDACSLARGFYDRLPAARQAAVDEQWMDAAAQRRIARDHGICPYYLGQELLRWADVLVADVHHAFDPHGQLYGLLQALDWRLGVLVDEGHNLIDRTRAMYSAELSVAHIAAAAAVAPAGLRPRLRRLMAASHQLAATQAAQPEGLDAVPNSWATALADVTAGIAAHLQQEPLTQGPLLECLFAALRMQRRVESFGAHSLFEVRANAQDAADANDRANVVDVTGGRATVETQPGLPLGAAAADDVTFCVHSVVPAPFLKPRFEVCHSVTVFSATLGSSQYQQDLLGLPADTAWLDVPPVFPAEHLQVRVAPLSTRYDRRQQSLDALVDVIGRQCSQHRGNYLAFFSSFEYLALAAQRLAERWPGLPLWRQHPGMAAAERALFLGRFVPEGHGVGLAVLGGAFAEGVDLPGRRLIGAFVATLGLSPVSPLQNRMRDQLDRLFGADHGYADLVPGLQKVVQAAGRVLRTPEDRGWLWLIDERYARPQVARHLPPAWGLSPGEG